MTTIGSNIALKAAELVSETQSRLLDALAKQQASPAASTPRPAAAAGLNAEDAGLSTLKARNDQLALSMLDARLLEAAETYDTGDVQPPVTRASRALETYLDIDGSNFARGEVPGGSVASAATGLPLQPRPDAAAPVASIVLPLMIAAIEPQRSRPLALRITGVLSRNHPQRQRRATAIALSALALAALFWLL